jgi:hypothetical protein
VGRQRIATALLAAAVVTAAGCGGGTAPSPQDTTAASALRVSGVAGCLRRAARRAGRTRVTRARRYLDTLAQRAGDGSVAVLFEVTPVTPRGLGRATVVVERSAAAARSTLGRYRAVYRGLGADPRGQLVRVANAVVVYQSHPTRRQRALLSACVRR